MLWVFEMNVACARQSVNIVWFFMFLDLWSFISQLSNGL